jgi:glycosyltransferase-like protein
MALSVGIFIYSTKPRGSVVHASGLAEALTREGHDVTVYALGKSGRGLYRPLACAVEVIAAADAPPDADALIRQRIAEFAFGFAARELRHDVFHAQDCLSASALLAGAPRRFSPVVRTVHHVERFESPYLASCQRRSILDADAVFSVSRMTQRQVLEEFGRTTSLVHNGVDPGRFSDGHRRDRDWLAARFGIGKEDVVLLSVGGVEPRKNTRRALAAVARVFAECPSLSWIIAGGDSIWDHGEYEARFEAELADLPGGLATRVVRTGTLDEDDMSALYCLSDVLVCPSEHEGFGLCVLEAMAAGTPVLVPGREPFTEYLDSDCAAFVDSDSVDSIADALLALVFDGDLRARRAACAKNRAADFTWGRSAATHLAHYRTILRGEPTICA